MAAERLGDQMTANYRLQILTTIYPAYLRQFLLDNPDRQNLSYEELYDRLVHSSGYFVTNFPPSYMEKMGNETQLVIACQPLQNAWARENGVQHGEGGRQADIIVAQVKAFQPDVVYLQDLYFFDQNFRQQLRRAC